nr:retrovirus-related Pol polyprotein from transposon TNT 1-94 [Tanacetum cinerariifolium]
DDDVELESGEELVARGRSSDRGESSNKIKKHRSQSRGKYSNKSCKYCKKLGHIASDCYKLKNKLEREELFTTYESFNGGNVYTGNHYICPVIGKGNIQVKMHDGVVRTITGVRHVPDLKRNMISLTNLEANGCKYSGEGGVMKIFKGALVLMKAVQSGGLYVLQSTVVYGTAGVATSKASLDDSKLWHYRLGHMGEKGMKNLAKKGLIKVSFNLEFCEHCVFGKHKKVSFSHGIHRTRDALDYIHSDLWGPSHVTSRGGKRYMLTIIDDFSRKVWVFFLKHKDEVFLTFKEWNVLIENQTGKKIKKLRKMVLSFVGKVLMPYAESMALHDTTHLLGHRSNSVDYSDLKVFRCPVYVHVNEGKLVSRAVKCIFLGYGSGVKGYHVWCPDPKYRKIIHSQDVTFNEDVIINSRKDFVPPHNVDNNHIEDHIENCEPTNYLEAISSPECDKWVVAMKEEVESLHKNETWELVKLLKEKRVISCKWLFKVKDGIPGVESNRYKARYVVRGFDQREDGSFLYLVLYVDDMLIAAPNKDQIGELKDQLSNEFDMKYLGAAKRILGMKIRRNRKMGKRTLSQTDYISKVLKKFNIISCKPVPTPLAPHLKLSSHECPKFEEDKEDMSRVPYSSAIGSLMYAMVYTRPDLAHAISVVSRYMHNPGKMHWEAVKCIIRYLKGTSNIGLSFEKGRASPNGVVGYVDSDYAGDLDARKSLSSHIFSHCGSAISWYSSLQAITALSTTKAEYISSTEGVKEAIWLRGMVNEFGLPQEVLVVYCDNRSAMHLTKNNKFHSKTKHIEVRPHFVRDIVEKGEVIVDKIHTNDNPADTLTKVLTPTKFKHCLDLVGIIGV